MKEITKHSRGYYDRDERETVLTFDEVTLQWKAWSTSPRHIERISQVGDVTLMETDPAGTITTIQAYLTPNQIRFYAPPSEKQREHMAKMRSKRLED